MSYLRPCVNEEIIIAVQIDSLDSMDEAIHSIKQYLEMAVMPLCLRRLEVFHYKPLSRQSQTLTTQTVVQMFNETKMFEITLDELLYVVLLNTVQVTAIMTKMQERLH